MKQLLLILSLLFSPFVFVESAENTHREPQQMGFEIMFTTTKIGERQANGRDQTKNVDILPLLDEAPPTVKINPKVWKSFVDSMENDYRNKGQEQAVYDGMICAFPVEDNNTDTGSDAGAEQSEFDCKPFNFSDEVQTIIYSAPVVNETGTALDALREPLRNNKGNFFRSPVIIRDYPLTIRYADEREENNIGSHPWLSDFPGQEAQDSLVFAGQKAQDSLVFEEILKKGITDSSGQVHTPDGRKYYFIGIIPAEP